jgi:hypothetical protein
MTGGRVAVAIGLLAFGVIAPQLAGVLAAGVLLAACVAAVAVVLVDRRDVPYEPVVPFGRDADDEAPTLETPDVSELIREIAISRRGIPPRTAAHLRDIARGRLLDGHRIDLADPADRVTARTLISPSLAAVVLDDDASNVSVRDLDSLLDELEHL